jgi:hypothetical protein
VIGVLADSDDWNGNFVDIAGFEDGVDCRSLPDFSICDANGASAIVSAVDGSKLNDLTFVRVCGERFVQVLSPSRNGESGETMQASGENDCPLVCVDNLACHGLVVCHDAAFCHVQTLFWKRKLLSF